MGGGRQRLGGLMPDSCRSCHSRSWEDIPQTEMMEDAVQDGVANGMCTVPPISFPSMPVSVEAMRTGTVTYTSY